MSFLKIYKSKLAASGNGVGYGGPDTLNDSQASFLTTVSVGDVVSAQGLSATVVTIITDTDLILSNDLMNTLGGQSTYEIFSEGQGDTYSLLNAAKYLFVYQANTGGGEIRFIYSDDVNSGYLNINTSLTSDAAAESYIQSINDAIGNLSNGVYIGPTNVVTVEAPSGAIITGFSFQ
tara:strand:- start:99 stop:629 length:531 start_codon:yes stop_codon:yes gene_type:complete